MVSLTLWLILGVAGAVGPGPSAKPATEADPKEKELAGRP